MAFFSEDLRDGLSAPPEVFTWHKPLAGSGGYSGLIIAADGTAIIAASDRGHLLDAKLQRTAHGQILGLNAPTLTPVLWDTDGQPTIPFHSDLEGLAPLPDGRVALAFESYTRLQILPAGPISPAQTPQITHTWDRFERLFGNYAFEAITALPNGRILAIVEGQQAEDQTTAYIYDGIKWEGPSSFAKTPGFTISGADLGPNGCLYILERRFGIFSGFEIQLTRRSPEDNFATGKLLFRSKPMQFGNGEGISVWQNADQLMASVITDNGFLPLIPTRIIEFPLRPGHDCADQ